MADSGKCPLTFPFFPSACEIATLLCTSRAKKGPVRSGHSLIVNYGEYPPGKTRKVGGILVMISFSPLIFPASFCGLWRINVKYEAAQTSSQGCTLLGEARSSKALGTRLRHLWCSRNVSGIVTESVTSASCIGGVLGTGQLDCH